jgi:2-keto-3-deoxy-L-rhamnonate aldolase RhmA
MNPFLHLLRAAGAQTPLGTWLMSASPLVAEAIGHAGFDWAVLDMEHSPLELPGVVQLLQALSASKLVPVVRVPCNEPIVTKRVLDAGATTLLFPMVNSAEEARAAVAATRYPPDGIRGMAGISRASRFGTDAQYIARANSGIGVIVQLESVAALRALEAIAAVPGVDALFVGPADLSADMGLPGQSLHPQVLELMADAARRAAAVGAPIGTLGGHPRVVAWYRAAGYQFVALGCDLALLIQGAQDALTALRSQAGRPQVHTLAAGTHTE